MDPGRYEIVTYTTGNLILDSQVLTPDLFMLDKNITGVDGLDLCRFIKASDKYSNIPVVLLSEVRISENWQQMPSG